MTSLHVGNLHPDLTDSDLIETFGFVGRLESVKICRDWNTDQSRGYGYVNFLEPAHAQWALENFNGEFLMGRRLRISWSRNEPPQVQNRGNQKKEEKAKRAAPVDVRDKMKALNKKSGNDNKEQHLPRCSAPSAQKKEPTAKSAAVPEDLRKNNAKKMRKNKEQNLPECSAPSSEKKEEKADHAAVAEDLCENINALKKTGNNKEQHLTKCSAPAEKKEPTANSAAVPEDLRKKNAKKMRKNKEQNLPECSAPSSEKKEEEKADHAAVAEDLHENTNALEKKPGNEEQHPTKCSAPSTEKEVPKADHTAAPEDLCDKKKAKRKKMEKKVRFAPSTKEEKVDHAAAQEGLREKNALKSSNDNQEQHLPKCSAPATEKKELAEESGSPVRSESVKSAPTTDAEDHAAAPQKLRERLDKKKMRKGRKNKWQPLPECSAAPMQKQEEKAYRARAPDLLEKVRALKKITGKDRREQHLPKCSAPTQKKDQKADCAAAPEDLRKIQALRNTGIDRREQDLPNCAAPSIMMRRKIELAGESGRAVINRNSIKPAPADYTEARAASVLKASVGASRQFQHAMGGVTLQASKCPLPVVNTAGAEAQASASNTAPGSAVRRMLQSCRRALSRAGHSIRAAFRRRSSAK